MRKRFHTDPIGKEDLLNAGVAADRHCAGQRFFTQKLICQPERTGAVIILQDQILPIADGGDVGGFQLGETHHVRIAQIAIIDDVMADCRR